jgi:hypothetical protein
MDVPGCAGKGTAVDGEEAPDHVVRHQQGVPQRHPEFFVPEAQCTGKPGTSRAQDPQPSSIDQEASGLVREGAKVRPRGDLKLDQAGLLLVGGRKYLDQVGGTSEGGLEFRPGGLGGEKFLEEARHSWCSHPARHR